MTIQQIYDILFNEQRLTISEQEMSAVEECHNFLKEFVADKVIYGINTGFGPMAQWRVDDNHLKELQYNIIRSHATGAGEPLSDLQVKSAMLARIGTFLQARSGINPSVITLLQEFVNRGIYPFIPQHGSVGASGDLVQLAHIALCMIGEGKVHYKGEWRKSAEVLEENGLQPMGIFVREGLSVTNGTSVMTGISIVNQYYAENLLKYTTIAGAWINEIADSFDDYMSVQENICRRQPGQQVIARWLREVSEGSKHLQRGSMSYMTRQRIKIDTLSIKFKHIIPFDASLRFTAQSTTH